MKIILKHCEKNIKFVKNSQMKIILKHCEKFTNEKNLKVFENFTNEKNFQKINLIRFDFRFSDQLLEMKLGLLVV